MSDIGSVNEAASALSSVQHELRNASGNTGSVVEFLGRMRDELAGLGLSVERISAALQAVEEFITELDGVSESVGDLQTQIHGLAERN